MSLVLLFAWLATSWDAFSRYRMSGLLGGHMLAVSVCLTQVGREIRESRAAETIVLYPLKWTHTPSATNLPGKDMGLNIGHYLHKYIHQIHQN